MGKGFDLSYEQILRRYSFVCRKNKEFEEKIQNAERRLKEEHRKWREELDKDLITNKFEWRIDKIFSEEFGDKLTK